MPLTSFAPCRKATLDDVENIIHYCERVRRTLPTWHPPIDRAHVDILAPVILKDENWLVLVAGDVPKGVLIGCRAPYLQSPENRATLEFLHAEAGGTSLLLTWFRWCKEHRVREFTYAPVFGREKWIGFDEVTVLRKRF